MDLKRRIRASYQWRLFVPIVAIIWLMAIIIMLALNYRSRHNRIERIHSQIDLINARVISAYDDDIDPVYFLSFVERYYIENPLYDHIRISAYYNGKLLYNIGEPVRLTDEEQMRAAGITTLADSDDSEQARTKNNFYYGVARSDDRRLLVYTILPFDNDVRDATRGSATMFIIILIIAIIGTAISYFMARRLGHDVALLRDFAIRAGSDSSFVPTDNYSHDELGEISRQLVRLYNERNSAVIKIRREHNVAIHALEEKERIKRELTNNINHELKTPVGVIKGYVDTILEHPDMDEASRTHFLKKVSEHIQRLTQLMNDISTITRLEDGANMINLEPVNFHEVVFQAVNDYESSGAMGGMTFNYDIPTYCRVVGNERMLLAMLNNLTKNAVFYSKGTECNLILVDQDDSFYHFVFYDNGVGVKESSLPHIFERFYREDNGRSRKTGGTGLGLSIVLNTVEALGGKITAANREGGGLMFRFTLRRADDNQE